MGLKVNRSSNTQSTFKQVPVGMHLARCYRIIDKGTKRTTWKGTEKMLAKVTLQFEVHGVDENDQPLTTDRGEPLSISKNFTNSMYENANMRKAVQSWLGRRMSESEAKKFSIGDMLGEWAHISVIETQSDDGKTYTNIDTINPISPSTRRNLPTPHNELKLFDLDNPDMELFETFSRKMKEEIMSSPEWEESQRRRVKNPQRPQPQNGSGFEDMEDDIPFN